MRTCPRLLFLVLAPVLGTLGPNARADDAMAQCIAASEQGLDLRKREKLLEARKVLATCATTRCPDEIRATCEQRINDINGVLPSIVFDVKDASGADLPNAELTVDGAVASPQLAGQSTPIDPGPHTFTLEVAGQAPVERKLVIIEGDRERHETVVIGALGPTPMATSTVGAGRSVGGTALPAASPESPHEGGAQRLLGMSLVGVGAAGLVLGGVFGLVASSKWSSAKSDCGSGCGPSAPAQQEKSDAQSAATVATVGFVGGAVLAAAGVVLYFTAPSTSAKTALSVAPAASPTWMGLAVRGGF